MEGKRKPGIYLVTDTGADIELILADEDGQETLLSKRTPAEDLVAFVNRDFQNIRGRSTPFGKHTRCLNRTTISTSQNIWTL